MLQYSLENSFIDSDYNSVVCFHSERGAAAAEQVTVRVVFKGKQQDALLLLNKPEFLQTNLMQLHSHLLRPSFGRVFKHTRAPFLARQRRYLFTGPGDPYFLT